MGSGGTNSSILGAEEIPGRTGLEVDGAGVTDGDRVEELLSPRQC